MYTRIAWPLLSFFFMAQWAVSQETETEDIGTQTVTVTKAYTPTVADAFKIKSVPNLNDSIVLQKKKIEYSIFSVPVASTFTPAKGTASKVERVPPPVLYNTYASAGGGNPANVLAEFHTSQDIDRESNYTLSLNHNSSQGNIEGVVLDNVFANTQLNAAYKKRERDMDWGANVGLQHQFYNWYGLPEGFDATGLLFDEGQNYFMAEAAGHIHVEDALFDKADALYRRFWDGVESGENRARIHGAVQLPLNEEQLGVGVHADYVGGSFVNANLNSSTNDQGIAYGNLQVGIHPSLQLLRDDLSLNLGVNLVYGMDLENSEGNFYIYPAVTASYRLMEETVIAYGGVEGELRQNSYYDFVEHNPFVSPTLQIAPTDSQYNAYVGFKGQLLPNVGYNVKGSYSAENFSPLFKLNPFNDFRNDDRTYYLGNSFEVFYDDIKTLGMFAEINVDINRDFTLGLNAEVLDYSTETGNPAWNRPNLTASMMMDYQIGEKWFTGINLFFVGEREDVATTAVPNAPITDFPATQVTLESFFDANAHLGYRVNKQLSVFVKGANLANNNYQRWANFPVQGLQVLAGATYRFDL
ncbi:TonB-dependent receptor [Maribacter sp. 2307ULW6-5]|uniref:TonB-dependent receptor n=1 Tax=Maribacter sp. 2307ULW6-5 TaxID=3386275 RepID=UPI0039BD6184